MEFPGDDVYEVIGNAAPERSQAVDKVSAVSIRAQVWRKSCRVDVWRRM